MKNYSLTYTGTIIFVIGYLFKLAGVPFVEGDLQSTVSFITALVGVVLSLYGRWRRGDLSVFGARKPLQ